MSMNTAASQEEDLYLFQNNYGDTPAFAGQAFDDFLTPSPNNPEQDAGPSFLNPNDLAIKREADDQIFSNIKNRQARSLPSSDGSSRSSSSDSVKKHLRNVSQASTFPAQTAAWGSGINGLSMPSGDEMFTDTDMSGLEGSLDQDYEASNQQMASDFDFETAASTPSGFAATPVPLSKSASMQPFRPNAAYGAMVNPNKVSPRMPVGQAPFYFGGSREASPLNAMLPASQAQSPWSKHSPSSGLEETFNGITMNGDSPGNATFSPNLQFASAGFTFDPESSATPSTFTKEISSPPSTVNSADGSPHLTVYPTSLKSRVETQIPIRMVLSPLPAGVKKLRLPTYTVSKPKFLAKPEVEKSAEILELHTSLVCTSAMQDPVRLERAYARARGEELAPLSRPSPASSIGSNSSRDDEDKPLNGGEVRICTGCIQRERKRASRKKQKKPDEEEMFQKDEEKRVVVFNTNEVKEWVEPTKDSPSGQPSAGAATTPGSMQVELPMRIACYCRHQNEKLGFQVIFTIKDYRDKVIAQAITNTIMITDDHKTHNAPPALQTPPNTMHTGPQLPGAGVFSSAGLDMPNGLPNPKLFKQSFSTNDLHGLQHNFNPNFPMTPSSNPFAIPSSQSSATSATLTPRNLSRPASPTGYQGPLSKRRKQSGSGKLPSALTMTRLETSQAGPTIPSTAPNTAASSPFPTNMTGYINPTDRGYAMPVSRPGPFGTSPPTPSLENGFISNANRSFSFENMTRQAVISAPSSRQPSRPSSPGSNRNSFGATDANFGQIVSNQLLGQTSASRRPPPLIHKVVPAEGTMAGGTEVTLLGNGFYQGLEVMFGDTEATTTTYWGEKCLNCITPPAIQPGMVSVVFKHEHPQYSTVQSHSQTRHPVFRYIDDREMELYRLALSTVGKNMPQPTDDPMHAAQQLLTPTGTMQTMWPPAHGMYGGMMNQRQAAGQSSAQTDLLELESHMLYFLHFMDRQSNFSSTSFDQCRPSGLTLLHLASSLGLTRFLAGLLSRGANSNALDNNGNTPMHHAAMNGHTHIIHRLRLAGADHRIRSIRNFVPADLATSLLAHQATVIRDHQYRSRSVGGTPIRLHSRNASSNSLKAFWEQSTNPQAHYAYSDDSDNTDSDASSAHEVVVHNRRASREAADGSRSGTLIISRRVSEQTRKDIVDETTPEPASADGRFSSPSAYMMAWRDSLATQINQFQESAQWAMPNLPNLGQLPALPNIPDYQGNPMVRRVSSLFPHRPASRSIVTGGAKEGWWESLTGSSSPAASAAPPAYNELFPQQETDDDFSVKKSSTIQAAADAAVDLHFELRNSSSSASSSNDLPRSRVLSQRKIERVELRRDRKLFFFWIPLLAVLLALILRNSVPEVIRMASGIYEKTWTHAFERVVEVA